MDEQVNLTDRQKNLQEKNEMVITEGSSREDIELEKGSVNSFDFTEVKNIINEHFAIIKGLVRYSKEKDANVLTLSKQLQVYRDGLENTLFKRIALELIEYREGCRKSLREIDKQQLNVQDAVKYINYLKLDFEDMLENLGIECKEGAVFYNKKDILKY